MILLIDIGNSRIKWATHARGKRSAAQSAARPAPAEWPDFAAEAWATLDRPQQIVISNVADAELGAAVEDWTEAHWQLRPRFVVAAPAACGVTNGYNVPERLGADRWAALIAAHKYWRTPLCVVDAGTAVTIDVLAADGTHLGGLIIPGIELMRRSLLERSAGIRAATLAPSRGDIALLARDTRDGIDGGTLYGVVAAIDRITADIDAELGGGLERVLTGGDAEKLLPLLANTYHHRPELVLDGLAVIAEGT